MDNHYETLGINTSATLEEIRRAYRILARRYHPDVNPGKASEEKFKLIANAHSVLSDPEKRKSYDIELEGHLKTRVNTRHQAYQRQQRYDGARKRFYEAKHQNFGQVKPEPNAEGSPSVEPPPIRRKSSPFSDLSEKARSFLGRLNPKPQPKRTAHTASQPRPEPRETFREQVRPKEQPKEQAKDQSGILKISVIEVSVTMRDAIYGIKKTVEISEPEGARKISVNIPPGVRNGSVVHLRSRSHEDLVLIVRVAIHPFLSIQPKGLVAEIPISVNEAISGASISVPTLDEPIVIKIPPASQSGTEIRLKEKGIHHKDGSRGDLFLRLMIKIPESSDAVGIRDKASQLDLYYGTPVRQTFPKNLLDL